MGAARKVTHQVTDKGTLPVYATGTVEQPWDSYTSEDHETWRHLYARQLGVLEDRVVPDLFRGLRDLGIGGLHLPKMAEISARLEARTGFSLVGVEGLLPDGIFFEHLAARRFPVTWWIRTPEQLDYVSEPDFFHDMFGHVPLLTNPAYADFAQAFGRLGLEALRDGAEALERVARLYWFTIEFGLVATPRGTRIYGAGIASSAGESVHALESAQVTHVPFRKDTVMETPFRIDVMQETYFVLDSLETLRSVIAR
jgi:phenylalanine-4-hydroxylase